MPVRPIREELTMIRRLMTAFAACAACLWSDSVYAQNSSLVDQMRRLFEDAVVIARTPGGGGVVAHTPVFLSDPTVVSATSLIDQVSRQIGSQVSIFPLGSSSGGFTYGFDAALGTFNRTTETFGPAFAERAATLGKGKFSFGMNFLHTKYDSIDGHNLEEGDIKFNLLHQPIGSYVEGDVIQAALKMKLTSNTAVFFVNYGATDRLDIGLAVPIVHIAMDLTYHATILDFSTRVSSPSTHLFANGGKTQDFSSSGSASGIGDIVVRGKYRLTNVPNGGTAIGADLRLPSGDENNMLGTGATQARLFFIGSGGRGKTNAHVNVGYTVSGSGSYDQVNYIGGVEYAASPKVTVVGDLLGRTLRGAVRVTDVSIPHSFQQGPTAPVEQTTLQSVALTPGTVSSPLGTGGVKINPNSNLLISAHVLFPLNGSGLKSGITPVIGFEYSF